jgi:exonuclease SbcD
VRFLHTSDWHLGRTLHGVSLAEAQRVAVDHIVTTAIEREVGAVIVAGDVFDRAVPPIEALRLLNSAILRLHAAGITCILSAGNHDSGERLATYAGVLQDSVHLVGGLDGIGRGIELRDAHGPVVFYPLPYLEPDLARVALTDGDEPLARSHEAIMRAALARIADDRALRPHARTVLVGHAFVAEVGVSAEESDSERDLTVGGVAIVPAGLFDAGIDYVALGHLHRAQVVRPEAPVIRYSGSLLRYSFSETEHEKSVAIVELQAPGTPPTVELIAIPQPRGMRRIRGTMDELLSDAHAHAREDFVELTVTDAVYPERMHARLDEVFPFALRKEHAPARIAAQVGQAPVRTAGREPLDVMVDFLTRASGAEPDDASIDVLRAAYESVRDEVR